MGQFAGKIAGGGAAAGVVLGSLYAVLLGFVVLALGLVADDSDTTTIVTVAIAIVMIGAPIGAVIGLLVGGVGGYVLGLITDAIVADRDRTDPKLVKSCAGMSAIVSLLIFMFSSSVIKVLGGEWGAIIFVLGPPSLIATIASAVVTRSAVKSVQSVRIA